MSTIEDAIYNRLTTDSAFLALVSKRIYPIKIAQGSAMPAVSYNRVTTVPVSALGTSASLASSRFQFDCWSKTPSEAGNIANTIRYSLDSLVTTIMGVRIGGITMLDEFSNYEPDAELFRESMDFEVWHSI